MVPPAPAGAGGCNRCVAPGAGVTGCTSNMGVTSSNRVVTIINTNTINININSINVTTFSNNNRVVTIINNNIGVNIINTNTTNSNNFRAVSRPVTRVCTCCSVAAGCYCK